MTVLRGLCLVLALLAGTAEAGTAEINGPARVLDAGTILIGNAVLGLRGIEAPEEDQVCEAAGRTYRCGQEAAWALAERIERHWVLCIVDDTEAAGRRMATCYIGGRQGIDLGAFLVRQGWAVADRQIAPGYAAEEDGARRERRGMWAGQFYTPTEWRKLQGR